MLLCDIESRCCKVSERFREKFTPEGARAAFLYCLHQALLRWRTEYAPKHFELSANARYGFAPRTKKYMIRKARKFGHQKPLVLSGRSRQEILYGPVKVTITKSGKGKMYTYPPVYFWKSTTAAGGWIAREMGRATNEELNELAKFMKQEIVAYMNRGGPAEAPIAAT
jgi:hypothetical protein